METHVITEIEVVASYGDFNWQAKRSLATY
jgi:hypothetical protein